MDWQQLAECQRAMAQHLFDSDKARFARGVCGRAYYAAYSLVTSKLPPMTFGRGRKNPEHGQLLECVKNIAGLREVDRRKVRSALRRLLARRVDADYRPGITVDAKMAKESMRDASQVFLILTGSA